MTTDDLLELVRDANPAPAKTIEESESPKAEALLARVVASDPREPRRIPHSLRHPRLALVLVGVIAIGVVSPALGVGRLLRLLDEKPAPPAVTNELGTDTARAVIEMRTSMGYTATVYSATKEGRECTYLRLSGLAANAGSTHRGVALCAPVGETKPIRAFTSGASRLGSEWARFVFGKVSPDVASLSLVSTDGTKSALPLSHGFFVHELVASDGTTPTLVARNATGDELERQQLEDVPTGP